ncbi:DUF411 domain-containing protein [Sedimentitalea todarodis]|uniref:DUF411 domain-containing protein n=1 Tax=Sedimentitalea todarodis TaxID=1631240 RepID=A0ABU3VL76_9RHOB|nr:DUF411 domain-containing protein [Sedimentitalea todarodis]MDU9006434.1 DUF411 domain-containing protein [Sedimentitalea todarodis]
MNRRNFLLTGASTVLAAGPLFAATPRMEVLKSPTCGCCSAWIAHIEAAGLSVDAQDVTQDALWAAKDKAGITPELSSCHTGFIEGYVIEGHVPAADIQRLLAERPDALGLTVPGMPIGSPGMEMGEQRDPFDTLLVLRGGETLVFERHA